MAEEGGGKAQYVFQRSYRSSHRLNFNHWLIKELCGYLLHPRIKAPQNGTRIADVGAGTGIWTLETAAALPETVQHHGFDVSSDQFPPLPLRPKNVTFSVQDVFQPVAEEHLGMYDIVHAQLLVYLINNDDGAEVVIRHLASLLKPGGQLQWLEPDMERLRMKTFNPDASTKYTTTMASMLTNPWPHSSYSWLTQMSQLFEKCGLVLETRDEIPLKDHLRLPWSQSIVAGVEDVIPDMKKDGLFLGESLSDMVSGLVSEFAEGVTLDHPFQVFVASKS